MRKSIIRTILIICIIFAPVYLWKDEKVAKTSEYVLDIMADTVSIGEEFLVTIRVKSDRPMNDVNAYVTYDADKLEFVENEDSNVIGSEGLLYLREQWVEAVNEREYQIKMRALKEGEAILSAEDAVVETEENSNVVELSTNKTVLHIQPKRARSSSKLLENILVFPGELTQTFDHKNTEYTMTVGSDVTELLVSAVPATEDVVTEIEGNESLKQGENIVKVKAFNKEMEEKIYTIIVNKY